MVVHDVAAVVNVTTPPLAAEPAEYDTVPVLAGNVTVTADDGVAPASVILFPLYAAVGLRTND